MHIQIMFQQPFGELLWIKTRKAPPQDAGWSKQAQQPGRIPAAADAAFAMTRGEMSGRVNVGIEGLPDKRSGADRERAANNQILALSREFAEACGE